MRSIAGEQKPSIPFEFNGQALMARNGDTILMALLRHGLPVRHSEYTGKSRTGFCLMGACQDCWVTANDARVRACTTPVVQALQVRMDNTNV